MREALGGDAGFVGDQHIGFEGLAASDLVVQVLFGARMRAGFVQCGIARGLIGAGALFGGLRGTLVGLQALLGGDPGALLERGTLAGLFRGTRFGARARLLGGGLAAFGLDARVQSRGGLFLGSGAGFGLAASFLLGGSPLLGGGSEALFGDGARFGRDIGGGFGFDACGGLLDGDEALALSGGGNTGGLGHGDDSGSSGIGSSRIFRELESRNRPKRACRPRLFS
ncbi:hypothetical protein BWI17_18435 [Betaproteobacteria bacterium GR16-43]|nr:hypothetical protein BWI17_18435 [Betaproteobacteria bacterium GR16-43]